MSAPKTQRADGGYDMDGVLVSAVNPAAALLSESCSTETPVLVITEEAVKRCEHADERCDGLVTSSGSSLLVCRDCGSRKWNEGRWQRPGILRVGRVR